MLSKGIFLLCVLATLSQVNPSDLHRDIHVDPSPQLAFRDAMTAIKNTDIRGEIIKMVFPKYEETFASLNQLLLTKTNPEISEILEIFNYNFDAKLFVVRGNSVQVDPSAYERVLSGKAMSVAKSLSPKNFIQQFVLYTVMENQILQTTKVIRPDIESKSVPVESMTTVIATKGHKVAVRDAASDLISSIGSSVCDSLVATAYTQLNQTLNTALTFLDSISVSSGNNILVALITVVVDFVKEAVEGLKQAAEALTSSICSELFNSTSTSRKRRDVDDFALLDYGTRDIAIGNIFSGIFDVLWSLLASVLNVTLKSLVDSLITVAETYLNSFLEGTVADLLYGLIDSVFTVA